jgi:hypothetical protein
MLKTYAVVAALIMPCAAGAVEAAPGCLNYEPATAELRGQVVAKVFPGPPNYVDVSRGDAPENIWLLNLADPICVAAKSSDPLYPAASGTRQVQLVLDAAQYTRYKDLVGREVVVSGRLFAAHTGHHRTPVLITVGELKPVGRG